MTSPDNRRRMTDPAHILAFALAGDARLTLVSGKTGTRYTFRISSPDDDGRPNRTPIWFASLLTGSDNESNYSYFGNIREGVGGWRFDLGRKSRLPADSAPVRAFAWFWTKLARGEVPPELEVWHEGRCARCGRTLTVPESVASGFGPECVKKTGGFRAEPAMAPQASAFLGGKPVGRFTAPGVYDTRREPPAKEQAHERPFDNALPDWAA